MGGEPRRGEMKVLLIDHETSPFEGFVWGKYEQNVIEFTRYAQIICTAWKWLGEKTVHAVSQADLPGYTAGKLNDKGLVKLVWDLFDKADVIIAHNGDRFDIKVSNARFVFHRLSPPSHYQTVDTKKVAKKIGMFPSNKLGELGPYVGEGTKLQTGGFDLWKRCMDGDVSAWRKMKSYNKQDVVLLEDVYLKLLPWIERHPNRNVFNREPFGCPKCGSRQTQRRGDAVTATGRKARYQCMSCGGWSSGKTQQANIIVR